MTITVQTFDRLDDAAAALASEPSARFFGGGTLLMRAVNEGDPSVSTLLRTTDSGFRQIRPTGSRIEIGGGVTMADILATHELAFLHPAARAVGGPAVRNMASVGGNLFAPAPYGDLATALLALDATVTLAGGHSGRETPLEEVIANRDRGRTGIVASVSVVRPTTADAFRFLKVSRVKPGRLPVITIAAHLPLSGGRVQGA
ncbi:MAG: FAD binding domain-containing protein, partial [Methyloligellaceae bacterium]